MKFETEKKDGKIFVTVYTRKHPKKEEHREKVTLKDILRVLEENNIKHGKCIQSVKVTNRTPDRSSGVFIFELAQLKPKSKPKPKRKYTRRTSKKTPSDPIAEITEKKLDTD